MFRITLATGLMLLAATAVGAQEGGDPERGQAYAVRVCAECHAVRATDRVSPRSDVAPFATIANTPGMTVLALSVWLRSPHRSMPNFMIEAQDRNDVVAYIASLKDKR